MTSEMPGTPMTFKMLEQLGVRRYDTGQVVVDDTTYRLVWRTYTLRVGGPVYFRGLIVADKEGEVAKGVYRYEVDIRRQNGSYAATGVTSSNQTYSSLSPEMAEVIVRVIFEEDNLQARLVMLKNPLDSYIELHPVIQEIGV